MSTIHEDGALRRSTRTRSGRNVLGDRTNRASKAGATDELSGAAKKKPRLTRDVGPSSSGRGNSSTKPTASSSSASPPLPTADTQGPAMDVPTNPLLSGAAAEAAPHMELAAAHVMVPQCDILDRDKPHMVTEYSHDMYQYYKSLERSRAPTMYMHNQGDINARMRAILIDWLVEVHLKFKLVPPTLHLCVTLIDQYCTTNPVPRSKLQLVGVTALLIACKFEEIYPPEVRDCVYITDHAYTREEVLEMEMKMLVFFGYNVCSPTCYQFLVRFLRVGGFSLSSRTAHRANYFAERCLQEHEMLSYKPSLLAAAVVYLATSMEKDQPWPAELREYTGYTAEQIIPCARQVSEHVNKNPITASKRPLHAVRKKFESSKFLAVAEESPPVL